MLSPRTHIASQLGVALAAVLAVVITGSTLFALHALNDANLETRQEHLLSEARLLADQLDTFHGSLKDNTQRLSGLFERRFATGLALRGGETVTVAGEATPALYLNDRLLNNDVQQVDDFKDMTAGVATVFVRSGDDFVRISTSLTKQDGSRALGTRLDRQHPAYARLLSGQPYVGRAVLFERNYMTRYVPVRDGSGQVIAALFVGFDYTDAQTTQFANLTRFRIGQTGSLALLDEHGTWLVAPAEVSDLTAASQAFAGMDSQPGHFWQDGKRTLFSVTTPFVEGPWTVVASMPEAELEEVTWNVGLRLAIGSLLAMALAIAATLWLLRRKLRPLAGLVTQAQALGAGDLGARLPVTSQDEIGQLAGSFNQMADALTTMVEHIRQASGQVSERAHALAGLSAAACDGMERQSGEITSMAGAVEEFSATSLDIADNMAGTERTARDNAQQTRVGRSAMDEASTSLRQIADALGGTAAAMDTLGARSQEIGGIVGVITAIAEQTNLLALNAAIEAARAGEQGRGFAVVADEVRSLAGRTRQATDEISGMIASIQQQTEQAIGTLAHGNQLMHEGLARNDQVAQALAQIDEQSRAAGEQFALINTATQEQSSTATVLSRNLQSIAQANGQQHEVANDLAATAQELEGLAAQLRREVDRFRVNA